jgi:hypothetical protein
MFYSHKMGLLKYAISVAVRLLTKKVKIHHILSLDITEHHNLFYVLQNTQSRSIYGLQAVS